MADRQNDNGRGITWRNIAWAMAVTVLGLGGPYLGWSLHSSSAAQAKVLQHMDARTDDQEARIRALEKGFGELRSDMAIVKEQTRQILDNQERRGE